MSRETKIGMVVAVSFLCLVGVVVATKWRNGNDPKNELAQQVGPREPGSLDPKNKPAPKSGVNDNPVAPTSLMAVGANPPALMPPGGVEPPSAATPVPIAVPGNNSAPGLPNLPPPPNVGLPNLPLVPIPMGDPLLALQAQIEKDRQNILPALPDPLQKVDSTVASAFNKLDETKNKAGAALDGALNKGNNVVDAKTNDTINKVNDFTNQTAQGTTNKFDELLNKGNNTLNQGLENVNKGFDNANKNLTLPPPPTVNGNSTFPSLPPPTTVNGNSGFPSLPPPATNFGSANPMNLPPPPSAVGNKNSFPSMPLPTVTNDFPRPVIPAPTNPSLPVVADNKPSFTIPSPNTNNARVVNYDVNSFQARAGDTFTSLSKAVYGTEAYGNALLAYNRDFSSNRSMTTLQPGQTVLLPPVQILQERYATAGADVRPGLPAPPVSINTPAPVIPNRSVVPASATTDFTKSYRVPAQGQMMWELAVQTLGDGNRWSEIYRLNSNLQPLQPVAGGTVIRLPGNANVP